METGTMLDRLSTGIERVLKAHQPNATPRTRKMAPDALMEHALAEIRKAAGEPVDRAQHRLSALSRAVQAAKQAFTDGSSDELEVEVFEEETTAAADESEKESSPVALEAALGSSAFAANAEDLKKSLGRLAQEISSLRTGTKKSEDAGEKTAQPAVAEWPFDMNTKAFREGLHKADENPMWGFDADHAKA
jgi:hypothetical protein